MKLLFLVPYPKDCVPGQRLKFEQYFSIFKERGIQYEFRPFMHERLYKVLYKRGHYFTKVIYTLRGYIQRLFDVWLARKFDMVYIFLYTAPFGPPVFEYLLKLMGKKVVYDIDDMIALPHSSNVNRFTKYLKSPSRIKHILRLSDHVIVVTKYLEKYALKYNSKVTPIPPAMDMNKYFFGHKNQNGQICIGWSGSHSTLQYISQLEKVLKVINAKYGPRCKIKIIGDKNFRFPNIEVHAVDWSLSSEVAELKEIDIGLYPLPDCEWVLGKGGLKAIQYMALGIPPVCTRIGEAVNIIKDGVNGFLVSSDNEWIEKISILIEDGELRKRMGQMARKTVEEEYSLETNADKYVGIFENLMPKVRKTGQ